MSSSYDVALRFQRLPLTPTTLHACCNDSASASLARDSGFAIKISAVDHPQASACFRQHACVTGLVPARSVVLTASACALLRVQPGEKVVVARVDLFRAFVWVGDMPPNDLDGVGIVVSSALAKQCGLKVGDEVSLCPKTYEEGSLDAQVRIAGVGSDSPSQVGLGVWIDAALAQRLGLTEYVYVHVPNTAEDEVQLQVLEHPGFALVPEKALLELKSNGDGFVEVFSESKTKAFAQIHPLSVEELHAGFAYIDPSIADFLGISTLGELKVRVLRGGLYWAASARVDDIRSKARMVSSLNQRAMTEGGYREHERVSLFLQGQRFQVILEKAADEDSDGVVGLTPLVMRRGGVKTGQAVFIGIDHEPQAIAKVGILNVEEIGSKSVKGSQQLNSLFGLPCRVELRNTRALTSLDIDMELDSTPRAFPMVRMSRTTRQLLSLGRGEEILIRTVPAESRSLKRFVARLGRRILDWPLLLLIRRRQVQMVVAPAHIWDDQSEVARVSQESLAILGLHEGDRLRISYRGGWISRTVLVSQNAESAATTEDTDADVAGEGSVQSQIGLDAKGRYVLGEGHLEFGTVVEVERNMGFILRKSLNLSILPLVGTVITLVTLLKDLSLTRKIGGTIALGLLFFYLALSNERSQVD